MRSERRIKKLVSGLHDTTSAKMDERVLGDVLRSLENSTKRTAVTQPNMWRIIMKSPITKLAAAAVIIIAVMLSIHLWDKSTPSAYAFVQTVEAMQGKRSFHIQTYFQQRRKDEFWAQFDEQGNLIRFRQHEGESPERTLVTIWEDNVKSQYYPPPWGVHLMTRAENTGGGLEGLEEFDPETIVQEINALVTDGKAIMEIQEPSPYADLMTIDVTRTDGKALKKVLVVDPDTKLVVRVDDYWGREGEQVFHHGIEVLEYNKSIDPRLFKPDFPEDTMIIDQVSQEVGMDQGKMTDEEAVVEIVRQALEAWAKGDYARAGKLWGGAPTRLFLTEHFGHLRPVSTVSVGQPEPVQNIKPVFRVKCRYEVKHDGEVKTVNPTFTVIAVDGQPGRWYVSWFVATEE